MRRVIAVVLVLGLAFGVAAIGQSVAQTCSVQAFFVSPHVDGVIENELVNLIGSAESSLAIAMYSFTDDQLGAAVIAAAGRGVGVRVLLDDGQDSNSGGREWPKLIAAGIPVVTEHVTGLLHDKFVVIDHRITVTGSYNWSASADQKNFENVVVIQCPGIAAAFTDEFNRVWSTLQAGGIP